MSESFIQLLFKHFHFDPLQKGIPRMNLPVCLFYVKNIVISSQVLYLEFI